MGPDRLDPRHRQLGRQREPGEKGAEVAAFGALEAFVMFGSGRTLKPLESALDSPLAPLVAIVFAVPLVAAVTMAIGRRRRERA
jgi:hypothetical protein